VLDVVEGRREPEEEPGTKSVFRSRLQLRGCDRKPGDSQEPMRVERRRDEAPAHEHGLRGVISIEQCRDGTRLDGRDGDARLLPDCQEEGAELGITDHQPH
jgi:hypothetical protein